MTTLAALMAPVALPVGVGPVLYGAYRAGWAFFALGPQLVICLLFAWSACKRVRGDLLAWLTRGFLWSLLPFVGVAAMWWIWRGVSRGPGERAAGEREEDRGEVASPASGGPGAAGGTEPTGGPETSTSANPSGEQGAAASP